MTLPPLEVRSGSVVALRLFDVAYAVELARVEQLLSGRSDAAISRSRLMQAPAKALTFDVPPVALSLGQEVVELEGVAVTATVGARIYDFGVVALSLSFAAADRSWTEFTELVAAVDRAVGPLAEAAVWERLLTQLRRDLEPALLRPAPSSLQEDYLMAVVRQWSEPIQASELAERVDLVPLLTGESRPLSEAAQREALRHRYSYYTDDLVVLNWERAFICDPHDDPDILDVLEMANAQLLEMRYYDELLDDELPRMYDLVEETRRAAQLLAPRRFANLARRLYTLVAEVTELTEKVDNALQVTEDVYLARVYSTTLDLLRVPKLSAAVDRKLSIIRDTYTALYDEASASRSQLLEITIVLLILVEIVMALLRE
ncbi:hypothetical protein [Solimonas sp. K1W22B-7]|uniref:hypothetical protein n=1 Tax=Solimonas sp. K1W22B-7 TaxID=2303331 RepID=UPI0013C4D1B5|nr:hypothetical protein [Solimonas sp. K1W22B-7]